MRIVRLSCSAVRIPFRVAFSTAHGALAARAVLILRLETEGGAAGLGEASAVPGFGGSLAAIEQAVLTLGERLLGTSVSEGDAILASLPDPDLSAAAARFGLDTAVRDLCGQAAGVPIAALVSRHPSLRVPVNATIGAAATEAAAAAAAAARDAGYPCLKLKAGVAGSDEAEVARVLAVRRAIGEQVALRIDANGAWQPAQAIRILRALESCRLEYVEQPVAAGDLAGMARVRQAVATPVAADESAGTVDQVRRVIEAGAADVIVIKPMLAGRLCEAAEIAALAQSAGLAVAVTSTLDSGVGVAAALQLAAALPARLACGLATASLLESDLLASPLPVERGTMAIPQAAGLGVRIDPSELARRTTSLWELTA